MSELIVTPGPHIKEESKKDMLYVLTALIPAFFASLYFFGVNAFIVISSAVLSAVFFEVAMLKISKKEITGKDIGSAALTGLLFAFCVSSAVPFWIMIIGSFIAIVLVKHAFGGLGFNIFNPALVARAFLLASWPVYMTTWFKPFSLVTSPTPLGLLKEHKVVTDYTAMLFGNHSGSIGETSALLLLLGGLFLLYNKIIDFRIPFSYMGTVFLFSFFFGQDPIFNIMAGGLVLGAFYMATDPVTSPVTKPGRWIFGFGCGIITVVIRFWGGYPEGVCYSILIMNAVVPLIDRYMQGRIFGKKRWQVI